MYQPIPFPQTEALAKGRNGFVYSCGIVVSTVYKSEVQIENISTRGDIGAARVVIPLSHIPALQAALAAFVAEHTTDVVEAA